MSSLTDDVKKLKTEFPYATVGSLDDIPKKTNLKDSTALEELSKLSKLIKSNATKLGIISTPDKIFSNEDSFRKQLTDFMDVVFYLLSLVPLFHDSCYADYFVEKVDHEIVSLILSVHKLSDELVEIVNSGDQYNDEVALSEDDKLAKFIKERLISIGMLWSQCDNLELLSRQGNLGLLNQYMSSSVKLLQDSIEELQEWLEDPVVNSDPFGMDDNFSEDEENDSEGDNSDEVSDEMISFVEKLLQKSKLLKLLLGSLSKSVEIKKDTASTANSLSELNQLHKSIVTNSDIVISSTLMNVGYDTDPEIETAMLAIQNDVNKITKIVTTLNKADDSKLKWIKVWSNKWDSLK